MIASVKDGQSLLDVALMVTGAAEGVWALALRNGRSVTGALECGDAIAWESEDVEDRRVAIRYRTEGICPATEVSEGDLADLLREAIVKTEPTYLTIVADEVAPESTRSRAGSIFAEEFDKIFS